MFTMLLIVPYGIETPTAADARRAPGLLLIVPYGIETNDRVEQPEALCLLIVPYGIET